MKVQQIFGPLNLMAWLEAPWAIDVRGVVDVVRPIHFPIVCVVLPNEPTPLGSHAQGERLGEHL